MSIKLARIEHKNMTLSISKPQLEFLAVATENLAKKCVNSLLDGSFCLEDAASCCATALVQSAPNQLFIFVGAGKDRIDNVISKDTANALFAEFCATIFSLFSGANISTLVDTGAWSELVLTFLPDSSQRFKFTSSMLSKHYH